MRTFEIALWLLAFGWTVRLRHIFRPGLAAADSGSAAHEDPARPRHHQRLHQAFFERDLKGASSALVDGLTPAPYPEVTVTSRNVAREP
jgi:hypothetical protein